MFKWVFLSLFLAFPCLALELDLDVSRPLIRQDLKVADRTYTFLTEATSQLAINTNVNLGNRLQVGLKVSKATIKFTDTDLGIANNEVEALNYGLTLKLKNSKNVYLVLGYEKKSMPAVDVTYNDISQLSTYEAKGVDLTSTKAGIGFFAKSSTSTIFVEYLRLFVAQQDWLVGQISGRGDVFSATIKFGSKPLFSLYYSIENLILDGQESRAQVNKQVGIYHTIYF